MFIQLQFTLAWYMLIGEHIACHFYPMLSSVTAVDKKIKNIKIKKFVQMLHVL
jgi:hypothetical protein